MSGSAAPKRIRIRVRSPVEQKEHKIRSKIRIKIKGKEERDLLPPPPMTVTVGRYQVSALGMGTLPLGTTYAPGGRPDREAVIELVHAALELGVRFFDTADTYGSGPGDDHYVERLLTEAVQTYEGGLLVDKTVIATKTGMKRISDKINGWRPRAFKDGAALKEAILTSYRSMGGTPIKMWWFHHTDGYDVKDPTVFQAACTAVKELMDQGVVEHVGLCNCSTAHMVIAMEILPITAVQNAFSLYDRAAGRKRVRKGPVAKSNKNEVLEFCKEHDILFSPHGALGGTQSRDDRRDLELDFPVLAEMATRKKVSPQVLVLAWMRHMYPHILHIFGTRTIEHLRDVLLNVPKVRFTQKELDVISALKA
jgi:pyridoxine 4-dehydrogenase